MAKKSIRYSPAQVLLGSILFTILVGTALLCLPLAQAIKISLLDNFFTATSATTVTGLLTIPLSNYTMFGKCVILFLIQIGGIGLITMSLFMVSLFTDIGFGTQLMAGQLLELESWKNTKKLIFFIIAFTLAFELVGAFFIYLSIQHDYDVLHALFYAVYQSVSAFCNAGFSIFPQSFVTFQEHYTLLITTALLIVSGGLGFITWHELFYYYKPTHTRRKRATLSLQTKIALYATLFLIASAAILYGTLEYHNTLHFMSKSEFFINTLFNAISCRSAGFSTVNIIDLQYATQFLILLYAFIGSSPGSTGSGIKTTTFTIFVGTVKSAILNKTDVEIRGRQIPRDQVFKALAITVLSLLWIIMATFCLLITEKNYAFFDILSEVIAAFATLGLSVGITPHLSITGKLFIIVTMIVGRIGPLTMVFALRKKTESVEYTYPEERIMLG